MRLPLALDNIVGQRLIIRDGAVSGLAELITKLTEEMRKLV